MNRARSSFYACLGILALAYHFGGQVTATAQAPGNPVVAMSGRGSVSLWVMTANGDLYSQNYSNDRSEEHTSELQSL
jgi:hypothetical protein